MSECCFYHGKLCSDTDECAAGFEPAAIYHLAADGAITKMQTIPSLAAKEGYFAYAGQLYIEPLEVQIEFAKAANAEKWLRAVLLRHTERIRQIDEDLCVLAKMEEVDA